MRHSREIGRNPDWKKLYLAALFENNKTRMPLRIAEAQRVLAQRRSELLNQALGDAREIQALDNALFSLNALRSCLISPAVAA